MLKIALPKGRLGDKTYKMLKKIGYDCAALEEDSRKLVFENKEKGLTFFLVKPSDVSIYVAKGAADIGIVGKDCLDESGEKVYDLLDLGFGKCKFSIAAPVGFVENLDRPLVVATKFTNFAKEYFAKKDRKIELIKLNGSVELGPLVGLSDVILDLVETGTTLKENNLEVIEDCCDISARLIANISSFKFKNEIIEEMVEKIKEELKND